MEGKYLQPQSVVFNCLYEKASLNECYTLGFLSSLCTERDTYCAFYIFYIIYLNALKHL